jgi:hypothetical protein
VGPGFPAAFADELPSLNGDVPDEAGLPSSMITSLRFDPCFPGLQGPDCQAQLRLVAQPVFVSESGPQMLDDAAAHLFYVLTPGESDAVLQALLAIRELSPVSTSGPLRIHPGLAQGLGGALGDAVRKLVVAHCRTNNLSRVTLNTFAMDNWSFHRFDVVAGALEKQMLPHMVEEGTGQAWLRQAFVNSLDDPSGIIAPAPAGGGFTPLLSRLSYVDGQPTDPEAARLAAANLLRIENPRLTTTDDVDCASCHLATQARLFAVRNGVPFDLPEQYLPPEEFDNELQLSPRLQGNLGATISFGWHHNHDAEASNELMPSISQRTVNESVDIANFLRLAL